MSNLADRQPYKIVAERGSYEILKFLGIHGKSSEEDLISYLEEEDLSPSEIKMKLIDLENIGFISNSHKKNRIQVNYVITAEGQEAIGLIDVINGAPLSSIFDATNRISNFTLITHDMTNFFIDELVCQRDFLEVYVCSPWIRFTPEVMENLSHILESARRINGKSPRLHILTRPPIRDVSGLDRWNSQIQATLLWLKEKGAEISYLQNLHTKLFIIYGRNFGVALFGSENLTGAKNIELGIRIADPQIVDKLYMYWENIYNNSITR
jgi:hypothetical protein